MRLADEVMEGGKLDRDRLRRMIETALPIAKERAEMVGALRSALERDDQRAALALARRLCGLSPEGTC